ncbi:EF-hand domain-containing protein [Thermaurantiacus sp.]
MDDTPASPVLRRLLRILASSGAVGLVGLALLFWTRADGGRADAPALPGATEAPVAAEVVPASVARPPALVEDVETFALLEVPEPARPQSREEKRFARADRNDDGVISQAEFLANRRRNFDKLDVNGDGMLAFEEYAAAGIRTFAETDRDGDRRLNPAEFAATARPPKTQSAARPASPDCVCS